MAGLVFGDFLPGEAEEGIEMESIKLMDLLVKTEKNVLEPKKKPFAWANIIPPTPQVSVPARANSPTTSTAKGTHKSPTKRQTNKATAKSPVKSNRNNTPTASRGQSQMKKQGSTPRVVKYEPAASITEPKSAPQPSKDASQPPKTPFSWHSHNVQQTTFKRDTPCIADFIKESNPPKEEEKNEEPEPVQVPPKKPFKWGDQVIKSAEPVVAPTPVIPKDFASFEEAFEAALKQLDINALPHDIQKRGFVNQGNTCFQNVTLQALLACPPFLNLLVAIASSVHLPNPKFPAWSHMLQIVQAFEEPNLSLQTTLRKAPKKSAFTMPSYFLKAFQSANGTQQDALEFLEFVLDHLHNEFEQSSIVFPKKSAPIHLEDDGWEQIQKNGRVGVVHHNVVESESPITHLFKGTLRSEIRSGRKVSASTIEPFHCLHLTMTTTPQSLEEMIASSMADEVLETRGTKRTFFETLPVVLSCHIKRFTYDPKLGPLKLNTFVEYPFYLDLPTAYFSPKLKQEQAKYKLFAVIAHHGMEAIGGHYTMICCDAMDQWTCFDDDTVVPRTKEGALQENAYLLFYIRVND